MFLLGPYNFLLTREPGELIGSSVMDACFIKICTGALLIMGKRIVLILERHCVSQDKTSLLPQNGGVLRYKEVCSGFQNLSFEERMAR